MVNVKTKKIEKNQLEILEVLQKKIIEKETSWSREKAFCKRNILQKKREEITKGYN